MSDKNGVPDGWEIETAAPAPEASKGHDFKILGVNIHVPGEEKPRADSNIASVGGVGIAPEDALMAGQAVRGVATAAKAGGAIAGLKQAIATAAPQVKYEIARTSLRAIGVPAGVAEVLAMGISSAGGGGKKAPAASAPDSPHLDLSQRVPASSLTQAQIGERLAAARANGMTAPQAEPTYAPRPGPSSVPTAAPTVAEVAAEPAVAPSVTEAATPRPTAPSISEVLQHNQKQLNEAAQKVHGSVTRALREAGIKVDDLKKGDFDVLKEAVRSGLPADEVVAVIKAEMTALSPDAEFAAKYNLPSDAERRWPVNKVGLKSNAPAADAKYRRAK